MQGTWRIHQHVRSKKYCLLRPDRIVTNMIATMKQVHHGNGLNRQQCNTSRAHKELQGCGAHTSISENDTNTTKSGNNYQKSHIGKWSVRTPENNNTGWVQNTNRTGTTRHPPQECSRGVHKKFQGALPECPYRYSTGFSAIIVGQTPSTGLNNNQPVA